MFGEQGVVSRENSGRRIVDFFLVGRMRRDEVGIVSITWQGSGVDLPVVSQAWLS